jgi:hypothetical protein
LAFVQPALNNSFGLLTGLFGRSAQLAALAKARAASFVPVRRSKTIASRALPQRLTPAGQWAKLSGILHNAIESASAARTLQGAAGQQIDLAQYALSALVDELSAVMLMPGRRAGGATLHLFGNGSEMLADAGFASSSGRALAA